MFQLYERVILNFLGVQIDEKLGWKPHIEYVRKKLSKSIGLLKKARQYLPKECLRSLYFTFVYPYLTYCIHVWGKTFPTYLDPILKAHKRIVRIITHSNYRAHTQPLFKQLRILDLKGIYEFMIATFMYKFHDSDLPKIFNGMFHKSLHNYPTRQADNYCVPNWRLETMKRTVSVQGAMIWNAIPANIKASCSLDVFKSAMKKHILEI